MKQVHHISLLHFERLLGEYGIYQHAKVQEPRLSEGYCVDDNARAVLVLLRAMPFLEKEDALFAANAVTLCWKFLSDAQREDGSMYNFRTSKGVWLTHDVSGDMYARVLRACVAIISYDSDPVRIQEARDLMSLILDAAGALFIAPRACAEALIAIHKYSLHEKISSRIKFVAVMCTDRLRKSWQQHASQSWPWFEDTMTYANGILPHGMLAAFQMNPENDLEDIFRKSSNFLIATTIRDGVFMPIGNSSWYHRHGRPSKYDQQPIEAAVMLDFLIDLQQWDLDLISAKDIELPYDWFFGKNTASFPMADESAGTCYDGLHDGAVNENCGAESLLAYLWAEVRLRELSVATH